METRRGTVRFRWCISDHCRNAAAVIRNRVNPDQTLQRQFVFYGSGANSNPARPRALNPAVTQTIPGHFRFSSPSGNPADIQFARNKTQFPMLDPMPGKLRARTHPLPGTWGGSKPGSYPRSTLLSMTRPVQTLPVGEPPKGNG